MAAKWSEVIASPEFQSLSPSQQKQTQQRFFKNVISADSDFKALSSRDRSRTRNRFFNIQPEPPAQRPITPPGALVLRGSTDPALRAAAAQATQLAPTRQLSPEAQAQQAQIARSRGFAERIGIPFGQLPASFRGLKEFVPGAKALDRLDIATQIAAPTAGGIIGQTLAGPRGGAIGAGIGGALLEAPTQIGQAIAGSPLAPKTPQEALGRMGKRAGIEALFDIGGGLVVKGGQKILSPLGDKVIPIAKALDKQLRARGANLTLGQLTDSPFIDMLQEIGDSALVGLRKLFPPQGAARLRKILQPRAFAKFVDDTVDGFVDVAGRLPRDTGGEFVLETLTDANQAFKSQGAALFKTFDDEIGEATVDMLPLKREFQKIKDLIKAGQRTAGALPKQIDDLLSLDDRIFTRNAVFERSDILDDLRKATVGLEKNPKLARQLNKAQKLLLEGIQKAADGASPAARESFDVAMKFTREGKEKFTGKLVQKLSKTLRDNPENFVRDIFRPGATKNIKVAKEVLGQDTFNQLRVSFLEDLLSTGSKEAAPEIGKNIRLVSGQGLLDRLSKFNPDTLTEIFGKEGLERIKEIGRLGQILGEPSGGVLGTATRRAGGFAAIALLVPNNEFSTEIRATAGTILLAPLALSLLTNNPLGLKLLTNTLKLPPGSKAAAAGLLRLTKLVSSLEKRRKKAVGKQEPVLSEFGGIGGSI